MSELIKSNARRGKKTYVAFLDVRKAYPTCRRAAMLERLYAKLAAAPGGSEKHRPKLFSAVATMLRTENCRSKVVVDGAESAEYTVGHGLREGAVLSPVLYAVFIDDIARRLEASCSGVSVGGEAGEAVRCLLYADDICITADSQEDLQRALNVCQSFANESSFEYSMEKSQVVIFGGDYSFNAPAFTLMGQTMESVDRYKYLGLWFHESLGRPNGPRAPSRPPKSVASEYLQQRFTDEPGPGENTPVEERCIVGLWFNPNVGREGSWVAETRRLDENVDAETVEYYAGPRTSMKRMMERYCFLHKDYEPPTFRALDPWELQIEHICRSISMRTGLLRRLLLFRGSGCAS